MNVELKVVLRRVNVPCPSTVLITFSRMSSGQALFESVDGIAKNVESYRSV